MMEHSIDNLQKQSKESSQNAAIARAESDKRVLSQVTQQLSALVPDVANQDEVSQLREAKISLEERVRANENMLLEVRNGKASAENREDLLRTSTDQLLEEMAKLREMAFAQSKSSGPASDLQSLLIKWTSANNLLAKSQQQVEVQNQKLQSQEAQICGLSDQLAQSKATQALSVEEITRLGQRLVEQEKVASSDIMQPVRKIFF